MPANRARQHSSSLPENHYLRNCTPPKYWIELLPRRLHQLNERFGSQWCLVVAGDPDVADDYFVIPASVFEHLLAEEYMTHKGSRNPQPVRWQFQLRDHVMKLFPPPTVELSAEQRSVNVAEYHGIPLPTA